MSKLLIRNIGKMVSGDIKKPLIEADMLMIEDGKIATIGNVKGIDLDDTKVIDAQGVTLAPGLIDSHCHPVLGDFTPRQNQVGYIESALHGGVTTMVSAGEVHIPGRPKDAAGAKALAILAAKCWANFRPGGVKVLGGGVILEKGLEEKDFEEMAREGVTHTGEIGLGSAKRPEDTVPLVKWAKKYGMITMMHTGGTSIPGSSTVTADDVIATDPDIVSHINGGPTAVSLVEAIKLIRETQYACEIVYCGNPRMAIKVIETASEANAFERFIIGNDAPSGVGVIPLGILRVLNLICSLGGVRAEEALAMATGNTARLYKLDRGIIKEGYDADLVLMDAPMGSVGQDALQAIETGDIPAISVVIIDGQIRITSSRNTPPPKRKACVESQV